MHLLEQKVYQLAQTAIEIEDIFLVEISLKRQEKWIDIEIIIDSSRPVKITDCISVNKKFTKIVEEAQVFNTEYQIMVSSSGLTNPLKTLQQKQSKINRKVEITLKNGQIRKGVLKNVKEESITIEDDLEIENTFLNQEVVKIFLQLPF